MSYRPITDMWILARAKLKEGKKYYGAYLGGFPERARRLVGCPIEEPMLHVCGGMAKYYPYAGGFGEFDNTLDIDPGVNPDFVQNAEDPLPLRARIKFKGTDSFIPQDHSPYWGGILIDPPYSPADAEHYATKSYPNPNKLVSNAINALSLGRKVGIIHYIIPKCPNNAKFVALVGVICGFNNRIRAFSVYEKI